MLVSGFPRREHSASLGVNRSALFWGASNMTKPVALNLSRSAL